MAKKKKTPSERNNNVTPTDAHKRLTCKCDATKKIRREPHGSAKNKEYIPVNMCNYLEKTGNSDTTTSSKPFIINY